MLSFFMARRLDLFLTVAFIVVLTIAIPGQQVEFVEMQEEERQGFAIGV